MSLKIEGHLTSKSSPLAPVSCKLSKQFIVQQHLNAHYKNISKAKSAIDNKCPKSWYKYTNVKDQIRKERLLKSAREHIKPDNASVQYQNKTFRSEIFEDEMKSPTGGPKLFEDSIKPLGPRIYKNDVKSKIAQLRCYNAPKKRATARPMSAPRMDRPVSSSNQDVLNSRPGNQMPQSSRIESGFGLEMGDSVSEEDLAYLNFCNDVTNDILVNNIFTNRGISTLFDDHVSRNRHCLPMDTMLRALDRIRYELRGKLDPGPLIPVTRPTALEYRRKSPDPLEPPKRVIGFEYPQESSERPVPIPRLIGLEHRRDSSDTPVPPTGLDDYRESQESPERQSLSSTLPIATPTNRFNNSDHSNGYEEDQVYINQRVIKSTDISPTVSPKHRETDQCTVPQQALQWSLTSSDGAHPKSGNIDQLCEGIYDVRLVDNQPEIRDKTTKPTKEVLKINNDDENPNRNVHFSADNQIYSAPESEDHSLTDVTSLKPEDSEGDYYDDNNDSTCVESSLDLNNTFKGENLNETKYEDDFDD